MTKSNTVREAGISPQIVHAGERFFPLNRGAMLGLLAAIAWPSLEAQDRRQDD